MFMRNEWKLNIDQIDLDILYLFYHYPELSFSTTQLVKVLYPIRNRRDLQKKDVIIRRHLKRLKKMGLIISTRKNGKTIYKINPLKVYFEDNGCIKLIVENVLVVIMSSQYLEKSSTKNDEQNINKFITKR